MYAPRVSSTLPHTTKQAASHILRAAKANGFRISCAANFQPHHPTSSSRPFSSTSRTCLREYFPEPDAPHIRKTEASWRHPVYTEPQMKENIQVAHRETRDWSDKIALGMVKLLRWGTDVATGYKHNVEEPKKASDANAVIATKPYVRPLPLLLPKKS